MLMLSRLQRNVLVDSGALGLQLPYPLNSKWVPTWHGVSWKLLTMCGEWSNLVCRLVELLSVQRDSGAHGDT